MAVLALRQDRMEALLIGFSGGVGVPRRRREFLFRGEIGKARHNYLAGI